MKLKMIDIQPVVDASHLGIFGVIQSYYPSTFEWLTSTIASLLDTEYYYNHSGGKTISPMVKRLYDIDEGSYLTKIASIVTNKYKDKWNKLYDAFINSEYNPIENYSMVEEENTASKIEEDENVGTNIVVDTSGNENVFGFNTDNENGVEKGKTSGLSTTTGDYDDNHRKNVKTGDFDDNHRKLTRSGNIGVTTSQQMIESEIKLRQYNIFNQMFDDVDEIMCLAFRRV